jgi:hypothetical protein
MLSPEKKAEQFSQELDRYLLAKPCQPQDIPPEDQPDLDLGVQLLQLDLSRQSQVRDSLRKHLEKERGLTSKSPSHCLIQSAKKRQQFFILDRWYYFPAFLALVLFLSIWSWKLNTPSDAANASSLHPSPIVVETAVLAASQQPSGNDPMPVPTPLAPPSTGAYHPYPYNTAPAVQHTPFGLFGDSQEIIYP